MKAIVTVIGKDQVGIIAGVCAKLAEFSVNVLDISQTVMQGYFTMMMVVDTSACDKPFDTLATALEDFGQNRSLSVRIQREDIFDAMRRV
jgi:ACT domain-containing protein